MERITGGEENFNIIMVITGRFF